MKCKFRHKIAYFLCFSLLLSLFVSLIPFSSVYAVESSNDSDVSYVIGSPLTADGRTNSNDYDGISNYYDLLLRAFWEGLGIALVNEGYQAPTLVSCDSLLRYLIPYYVSRWESENSFAPTYTCNIYYHIYDNPARIEFSFVFVDDSSVNVSPFSYLSGTLRVPNYPCFVLNGVYSGYSLYSCLPCNGVFTSNPLPCVKGSYISDPSFVSASYVSMMFGRDSIIYLPFDTLPDSYSCFYSYPDPNSNYGLYGVRIFADSPLVTSFPIYKVDSSATGYSSFLYETSSNSELNWRFSNDNYIFDLTDDYVIYSEFSFYIYPTPTPFPTRLPTVTPTPLLLPSDSSIDGIDSGETLGFLYSLKGIFNGLINVFSTIPFINDSISYLYTYVPNFAFLLFIPLLAFLSFMLGRNKS